MDWSFMERFAPLYVQAAGLTLRIGSLGIALSLGVGLLCCLARYYRVPGLRQDGQPCLPGLYRSYAQHAPAGTAFLSVFWAAQDWHKALRRSLRGHRPCLPGRGVHGRIPAQRPGGGGSLPA